MERLVLIDGDILVYRTAFSCQSKHPITGEVEALPAGIARARCDEMIEEIIRNTGATSCMGFLTDGKGNFRNQVAKTQPYKGGRIVDKPVHYDMLREHLVNVHGYEMCTTQEADDMIGITHMDITDGNLDGDQTVIIASIDKDLLMIPGNHYNIARKEYADISIFNAMKNFFTQVLTGDRTDNIMGIKGIGPIKAEKILEKAKTYNDMLYAVCKAYHAAYGHNEIVRLDETAELIWIRRVAGVQFSFGHVDAVYQMYKYGGTK